MAVDLHPDVVRAINDLADTKLGRRFNRYAQKNFGISGKLLAAKQTAGEFGGRSTRTGRGVVSSAGARGPAQFIPSTRQGYMQQYGVDPWKNDRSAFKGLMLHDLNTGVAGYNPGMPTYTDYVLGQRINKADLRALRQGGSGSVRPGRPGSTEVRVPKYTVPGQDFSEERQSARRELLLGGDLDLRRLLEYKAQVSGLQDTPDRTVSGDMQVIRKPGRPTRYSGPASRDGVPQGHKGKKGGIYEVFYDPLGQYWDSGGVRKGAIGGHDTHVHVSADRGYIVKIGKFAQRMGLHVGEQRRFGGTPTGGHTSGSFHYKDMGIDVSGDPDTLAKFARIMMREARRGHGR